MRWKNALGSCKVTTASNMFLTTVPSQWIYVLLKSPLTRVSSYLNVLGIRTRWESALEPEICINSSIQIHHYVLNTNKDVYT